MAQTIAREVSSYKAEMHANPHTYDVVSKYTLQGFQLTLNRLLGENRERIRGRVLDLGCGNGIVTQYMKEIVLDQDAKLSGCDLSGSLIDFCRKKYSKCGIDFFQLDLGQPILGQEQRKFDWIFSNYVIHWVADQQTALTNCYNLLENNGVLVLLTVVKCYLLSEWPMYVAQHPEWKKYYSEKTIINSYNELSEEEAKTKLNNDLSEAGFGDVCVEYHTIWNVMQNEEHFKEFLKSICQFYPLIEPEKQAIYLEECVVKWKENECLLPVSDQKRGSQPGSLKKRVSVLIAKAVKNKE